MAKFKTKVKQLMLQKSVELGEQLTQQQVAADTGLSLPTISRWYNSNIDRLEADTIAKFAHYFGVQMSELVEVED